METTPAKKRSWNLFVLTFIAGAVLSPFAGSCRGQSQLILADTENPLEKSAAVKGSLVLQQALREIYKEVNPAVVRIETEQKVSPQSNPLYNDPFFRYFFGGPGSRGGQRRSGLGSGFVISQDGFVVTNHHVVKNVDKITVKLGNGKEYSAKLIGSDEASDIALLKIDDVEGMRTIHFGDSEEIEVGDLAIAIGNPYGLSSTFTLGVISSKGQDVNSADGVSRIQTDAAINPGNSGGPLLNIKGEVIGINQMIYTQSGGSVGIGFAIPISYALEVINKLKSGEKIQPGYIGVSVVPDITQEQMKELNLKGKQGLLVGQVVIGSPAWKSGLRPYDFITKIDGKKAEKFSILKSAVVRKGVGKDLNISYIRDGKEKTVIVVIGKAPNS